MALLANPGMLSSASLLRSLLWADEEEVVFLLLDLENSELCFIEARSGLVEGCLLVCCRATAGFCET